MPSLRRTLAATALAATGLATTLPASAAAATPPARTWHVTITNTGATGPLTPVFVAAHRPGLDLFDVGATASTALATLAETGDPGPLLATAEGDPRVTSATAATGLVFPGESASFEVRVRPGDRITLASMLACSNDWFVGLDAGTPAAGDLHLEVLDAGSEVNTGLPEDVACLGGTGSPDEGGVVHVAGLASHATVSFSPVA